VKRLYSSIRNDEDVQNVDMTPLIDMVFILLIFFIVTTVFVQDKGLDIERPSQRSAGTVEKESLLIAITKDGRIRAAGRNISINSLRAFVTSRLSVKDEPVVILADGRAPVDLLADVMDECRLAGAGRLSLATEDER
jgi:biopolymer transport protein ExbD